MKPVSSWFKEYQLYQITLIYMATRFYVNLAQSYIPLYIQGDMNIRLVPVNPSDFRSLISPLVTVRLRITKALFITVYVVYWYFSRCPDIAVTTQSSWLIFNYTLGAV